MKLWTILGACGALALASAAHAAISVTDLGNQALSSGLMTLQIGTTADSPGPPANCFRFEAAGVNATAAGSASTGVADDTGANYLKGQSYSPSAGRITAWSLANAAADLPLGSHITTTYGTSTSSHYAVADSICGLANGGAVDAEGTGATGSWSGSTNELSITVTNAPEVIEVYQYISGGNGDSFTEDTTNGWVTSGSAGTGGSIVRMAHQIVNTNGTYNYTPTLGGTARTVIINWMAIKPAPTPTLKGPCMLGSGFGRCL